MHITKIENKELRDFLSDLAKEFVSEIPWVQTKHLSGCNHLIEELDELIDGRRLIVSTKLREFIEEVRDNEAFIL
jgi:hypothetical protein